MKIEKTHNSSKSFYSLETVYKNETEKNEAKELISNLEICVLTLGPQRIAGIAMMLKENPNAISLIDSFQPTEEQLKSYTG